MCAAHVHERGCEHRVLKLVEWGGGRVMGLIDAVTESFEVSFMLQCWVAGEDSWGERIWRLVIDGADVAHTEK